MGSRSIGVSEERGLLSHAVVNPFSCPLTLEVQEHYVQKKLLSLTEKAARASIAIRLLVHGLIRSKMTLVVNVHDAIAGLTRQFRAEAPTLLSSMRYTILTGKEHQENSL